MRESPHPRVELEIATVRATRRPVPRALEEVLKRVEEAEARLRQQARRGAARRRARRRACCRRRAAEPRRAEPRRPVAAERRRRRARPRRRRPVAAPALGRAGAAAAADASPAAPSAAPATEDVATGWQRVIEDVMRRKPTLGAVLAQARPGGAPGSRAERRPDRKPLPS